MGTFRRKKHKDRHEVPSYWKEMLKLIKTSDRNKNIFRMWMSGHSCEDIGKVIGGLSRERVRQIRERLWRMIELAYAHKVVDEEKERICPS